MYNFYKVYIHCCNINIKIWIYEICVHFAPKIWYSFYNIYNYTLKGKIIIGSKILYYGAISL